MKPQAHIPAVSVGARDWRAAMIALVSLLGVSLLLTLRSGIALNNSLLARLRTSLMTGPEVSVPVRVSLDLHSWGHPISPSRRFSVAHPLPAYVALSQPFSIGLHSRAAFEVFGEAAVGDLLAEERTVPKLKPHNDRMMLMLMLLRLHTHRS